MFNKLLAFGFATVCALLLVQAAASSQAADPNPGAFGNAPRSEVRAAAGSIAPPAQAGLASFSGPPSGCVASWWGKCRWVRDAGNCFPNCAGGDCIYDDTQGGLWDCCTNRPVNPGGPFDDTP